jgi:hypothetical protein
MPFVRSNSGSSFSYAPLNPPDIKTFSCAEAAAGQNTAVTRIANDKALMIGSGQKAEVRTSATSIGQRQLAQSNGSTLMIEAP